MSVRSAIRLLLLTGFCGVAALYLLWGLCDEITDLQGDSSGYILAAQYFSPFFPASDLLTQYGKSIFYPPLFPILIGLCGATPLAGHAVVIASLLAALVVLFAWLRTEGLGTALAAGTTLLFALMPATYLLALNVWTENTYLLASLAAIFLVCRSETRDSSGTLLLSAIAVAAAPLTRVAGLPLLAAFGLYLVWKRPRGWVRAGTLAALPFAIWMLVSKLTQTGVGAYTSQWGALYATDPLGVLQEQLGIETFTVLIAWTQAWLGESGTTALYLPVAIIGALGIGGWLLRLARRRFDALYVGFYALELLAWPHPEETPRYAYPLFPLVLAYGVLFINGLVRTSPLRSVHSFAAILPGVGVLLVLPSFLLTARLAATPVPPQRALARHLQDWYQLDRRTADFATESLTGIVTDLARVGHALPENTCVFSIKPNVVALYTRRVSERPPASKSSNADFESGMQRCEYAYLLSYTSPSFDQPLYPYHRLPKPVQALSTVLVDRDGREKPVPMGMMIELRAPPAANLDPSFSP